MYISLVRLLAVTAVAALASACAQPARTSAMIVNVTPNTVVEPGSVLHNSVSIASVTGGEETNPLWISEVSSTDFRSALSLSLKQHTILADGNAPLTLSANLVNMDQPLVGLDMTVTSTVVYTITDATGATVFDETVALPYTANFSDAFVGAERLRLANEGAIKANIKQFIEVLIAQSKQDPAKFGTPATSALRLNLG